MHADSHRLWLLLLAALTALPFFLGFFADFAVAVLDIIVAALQIVVEVLAAVVTWLVEGVLWLWGVIVSIAQTVWQAVQYIGAGLKHIFVDVIGGHLKLLYDDYQSLKQKLADFFGPIIRLYNRIHGWYNVIFKNVIARILSTITHIRQLLTIFRLFHLQWAQEVDNALRDVQDRIIRNTVLVGRYLTLVGNVLNLLVNPLGLIRQFAALGVFAAGFDPYLRALTGHGVSEWLASTRGGGLSTLPTSTGPQYFGQLGSDLAANAGTGQSWRDDFSTTHGRITSELK